MADDDDEDRGGDVVQLDPSKPRKPRYERARSEHPNLPDRRTIGESVRSGKLNRAMRRRKVLDLRLGGFTTDQISQRFAEQAQRVAEWDASQGPPPEDWGGPIDPSGVSRILNKELKRLEDQAMTSAEDLRTMELARLDEMLRAIWPKVLRGNLQAIDTANRLIAQQARIAGLTKGGGEERQPAGDTNIFLNVSPEQLREAEQTFLRGSQAGDVIPGTARERAPELLPPA